MEDDEYECRMLKKILSKTTNLQTTQHLVLLKKPCSLLINEMSRVWKWI